MSIDKEDASIDDRNGREIQSPNYPAFYPHYQDEVNKAEYIDIMKVT